MIQSFSLVEYSIQRLYRLPNLLVNRLYLNLRATNPPRSVSENDDVPGLDFAQNSFLGNIGAPLDHDWWDRSLDYEECDVLVEEKSEIQMTGVGATTLVPVVRILLICVL